MKNKKGDERQALKIETAIAKSNLVLFQDTFGGEQQRLQSSCHSPMISSKNAAVTAGNHQLQSSSNSYLNLNPCGDFSPDLSPIYRK